MSKLWYAVMNDSADCDWDTGSFDLTEAKEMTRQRVKWGYPDAHIAVIDGDLCVEEIRDFWTDYDADNKEYRERSAEDSIPQRMFNLPDGTRAFLSPTGYEIWSEADPIPMFEYIDENGNLYYTR